MKVKLEILSLILLIGMFTGCKRAPIDSETMEDILFDMYRTDACISVMHSLMPAEERVRYYDSLFEKYDVTKDEFDEALDWYAHHPKDWQLIHRNLVERTEDFAARVENYEFSPKDKPVVVDSIDTLDLWAPKTRWMWKKGDGDMDRRQVDFDLDNRKFFIGALSLHFGMKMRCWSSDSTDSVTTTMIIRYSKGKNDTLRYVAPIDSVERNYIFVERMKGRLVSAVDIHLMDTIDSLQGVNVSNVHLKYAYSNKQEAISDINRRVLKELKTNLRSEPGSISEIPRYNRNL